MFLLDRVGSLKLNERKSNHLNEGECECAGSVEVTSEVSHCRSRRSISLSFSVSVLAGDCSRALVQRIFNCILTIGKLRAAANVQCTEHSAQERVLVKRARVTHKSLMRPFKQKASTT